MSMATSTLSTVRRLVLAAHSQVEPACAESVRSAIPEDADREVDVGFPLATEMLGVYRYRYRYIDEFRENRDGWDEFFSALERSQGRIGLLGVNCSGWRFIILLSDDMETALACLCGSPSPSRAGISRHA